MLKEIAFKCARHGVFFSCVLHLSNLHAGTCGGVTHPNIMVNPVGDYDLVPSQFSAVCQIKTSGTDGIKDNLVLEKNVLWVLKGKVEVGESLPEGYLSPITYAANNDSAAVVVIEAGATMVGDFDTANPPTDLDFLVVHRGSQLFINGTVDEPVKFTSIQAVTGGVEQPGQWGGIVINGYDQINICSEGEIETDCENQSFFNTGYYGGNNSDLSSGHIHYAMIENAGYQQTGLAFSGLLLNGISSSTSIDSLQVRNSGGYGLKIAGGSVNATHLVLNHNEGGLSWDEGWRGSIQYALFEHSGSQPAIQGGSNVDPNALPQSNPVIANATVIADSSSNIVALENATGVDIVSSVFSNTGNGSCFSHGSINQQLLTIGFSRAECVSLAENSAVSDWFNAGQFTVTSGVDLNGYINGQSLSDAVTIGVPNNPNVEKASFIGAVSYCDKDWMKDWAVSLPIVDPDLCIEKVFNVPLFSFWQSAVLTSFLVNIGIQRPA